MCALKFFPSSDVMNAIALKFFQLKELHFEHPCDFTWWEKPVFHGARTLGQNLGIGNLYFGNVGFNYLKPNWIESYKQTEPNVHRYIGEW